MSGHINHRAVSAAVRYAQPVVAGIRLFLSRADLALPSEYVVNDGKAPPAYKLVTTGVLRKYTVLLDLPLTALSFTWRIVAAACFPSATADPKYSTKALVANTWHRYQRTRDAFASHDSQYSWDRHLYMVLSRYVWFNDLKRIPGRGTTS